MSLVLQSERPAKSGLCIARGAFRILEERVIENGTPGLSVWTAAGISALREHQLRQARAYEQFQEAIAVLDVPASATKADLFAAIERANASLRGAIETAGLASLALVMTCAAIANAGDDDLARRPSRGRSGRRRDDVVELCDGETGEVLFSAQVGNHPLAEAVS